MIPATMARNIESSGVYFLYGSTGDRCHTTVPITIACTIEAATFLLNCSIV